MKKDVSDTTPSVEEAKVSYRNIATHRLDITLNDKIVRVRANETIEVLQSETPQLQPYLAHLFKLQTVAENVA